jgi:hypothetical protein
MLPFKTLSLTVTFIKSNIRVNAVDRGGWRQPRSFGGRWRGIT